jgi:plastocyanin
MRRLSISALVVVAAVIAACAAPAAPGWTYAPAPSVTPAPSTAASGSPAASASAASSPTATGSAEAGASAAASGSPAASGEAGLTIVAPVGAAANGFNTKTLNAAPGHAFDVTFDNQDTGVVHNWVLVKPDGSKVDIGDTTFFAGVAQKTYHVPALDAGAYPFMCEVHPTTMKGILTVS